QFFVEILKGYHWSGQHSVFDGLAQRLRAHGLGSDPMFGRIVMENAAERADADLAVAMARVAAQLPENIPKVVEALLKLGLASELSTFVDISQYPDNSLATNVRLCMALHAPEMAADPHALVDDVELMVENGLTPSFKLFFEAIRHIRLHGSPQLALQTYANLEAAGVPKSIELLKFVLQMHLELHDKEASIATYEELFERLQDSDFSTFSIHRPTMEKLVRLLIERRGIREARRAFDLLDGLPVLRHDLPYTALIEHYVHRKNFRKSRDLVSYIVQHDIPLKPRTINLYSRHLARYSPATDLANFVRYTQRVHLLHVVTDDVIGTLFALCAKEHKIADLEWIIGGMLFHRGRNYTWTEPLDYLGAVDPQLLQFVVHTAISAWPTSSRAATKML
ncbi:hypothetical protein IWW38_005044, partial [Coemansia aciculifera]